jgi:CheY-like chemotaxis protein
MKLNGAPTVLVVDDEELIREVAVMMIEEDGGKALAASDGMQAVELLKAQATEIDCILSDFSMPEMNGYQVYLEAVKIKPEISFVMVSGLKIVPEVDELRKSGKVQFVSKPFNQADLMAAINRARRAT